MKITIKHNGFLITSLIMLLFISCSKDNVETDEGNPSNKLMLKSSGQVHTYSTLFEGGTGGYHSYRIPAIVRTTNGTLIAFAEGRMSSSSDWGNINLICKRSTDHGSSWSSIIEIAGIGPGKWGDPCAVVDNSTGRVWVFFNWNSASITSLSDIDEWGDRMVYLSYSDDHGATWATPVDMTSTLLPPNYTFDAMGPGTGIQTVYANNGRLIIPAAGRNIYSDDHGSTWNYQLVPHLTGAATGEATIVEKSNGDLIRNDRASLATWNNVAKRRFVSTTTNNNTLSFNTFVPDYDLFCPKCEASIWRYDSQRVVFLNSASTETRYKMTVKISYDDCDTWSTSRRVHNWLTTEECIAQKKGGYSSMCKTADYCIGALIEDPQLSGNISIEFHKFNVDWMENN